MIRCFLVGYLESTQTINVGAPKSQEDIENVNKNLKKAGIDKPDLDLNDLTKLGTTSQVSTSLKYYRELSIKSRISLKIMIRLSHHFWIIFLTNLMLLLLSLSLFLKKIKYYYIKHFQYSAG